MLFIIWFSGRRKKTCEHTSCIGVALYTCLFVNFQGPKENEVVIILRNCRVNRRHRIHKTKHFDCDKTNANERECVESYCIYLQLVNNDKFCIHWEKNPTRTSLHSLVCTAATTIHFKRSNLRRNPMHCDKNLNAERKEIILAVFLTSFLKNDRLKLQLAQFSLSRVVRISGCYFLLLSLESVDNLQHFRMVWHTRLRAMQRKHQQKNSKSFVFSHSSSSSLRYFFLQISVFIVLFYLLHSFGSHRILLNISWCHIVSFILLQSIVQHFAQRVSE